MTSLENYQKSSGRNEKWEKESLRALGEKGKEIRESVFPVGRKAGAGRSTSPIRGETGMKVCLPCEEREKGIRIHLLCD